MIETNNDIKDIYRVILSKLEDAFHDFFIKSTTPSNFLCIYLSFPNLNLQF